MKKWHILLTLFLIPLLASSQEVHTYYYGVNGRKIEARDEARIYYEVKQSGSDKAAIKTYSRSVDGWILTRTERIGKSKDGIRIIRYREGTFFPRVYRREIKKVDTGTYYFTDFKGDKTIRKGGSLTEIPLHLDGQVSIFYDNGALASESSYRNNILLSNKNWNSDGSPYIDDIFFSVSKPPVHPYGNAFIQNFITERMAVEKFPFHEIHDDILIGCVILETGELTGVRILKGKVESVNSFFLKTMQNLPGLWEPARLDGEKVRYFITMPVSLNNDVPSLQSIELTKGGQIFWND